MDNIIAFATNGPAVGRNCVFIVYLKGNIPNVFCLHCGVHQQYLVAKNLGGSLQNVLDNAINVFKPINLNPLQNNFPPTLF